MKSDKHNSWSFLKNISKKNLFINKKNNNTRRNISYQKKNNDWKNWNKFILIINLLLYNRCKNTKKTT